MGPQGHLSTSNHHQHEKGFWGCLRCEGSQRIPFSCRSKPVKQALTVRKSQVRVKDGDGKESGRFAWKEQSCYKCGKEEKESIYGNIQEISSHRLHLKKQEVGVRNSFLILTASSGLAPIFKITGLGRQVAWVFSSFLKSKHKSTNIYTNLGKKNP